MNSEWESTLGTGEDERFAVRAKTTMLRNECRTCATQSLSACFGNGAANAVPPQLGVTVGIVTILLVGNEAKTASYVWNGLN